MSLYNAIFGRNQSGRALLEILGLTEGDCGRYRDCFAVMNDGKPEIHVLTRNGGGNREDYEDVFEELSEHPNYLGDSDDDFDCTYATIRFSAPEPAHEMVKALAADTVLPADRWASMLAALKAGNQANPDVGRALKVGEALMPKIEAALSGEGSGIVTVDGTEAGP